MAPPTVKQRILIGLMSDPWLRCTSCLGRCLSRCTRFPGHSFIDGARLEARETREWRARGSRDVHLTMGRTTTTVAKSTPCIQHAESYSRNGGLSSSPSTPDINPEPAANRGAFFKPRHQTNMARGKNY
ncbi:unnamed protein product [Boreogadus saida]